MQLLFLNTDLKVLGFSSPVMVTLKSIKTQGAPQDPSPTCIEGFKINSKEKGLMFKLGT